MPQTSVFPGRYLQLGLSGPSVVDVNAATRMARDSTWVATKKSDVSVRRLWPETAARARPLHHTYGQDCKIVAPGKENSCQDQQRLPGSKGDRRHLPGSGRVCDTGTVAAALSVGRPMNRPAAQRIFAASCQPHSLVSDLASVISGLSVRSEAESRKMWFCVKAWRKAKREGGVHMFAYPAVRPPECVVEYVPVPGEVAHGVSHLGAGL